MIRVIPDSMKLRETSVLEFAILVRVEVVSVVARRPKSSGIFGPGRELVNMMAMCDLSGEEDHLTDGYVFVRDVLAWKDERGAFIIVIKLHGPCDHGSIVMKS